jgi:hypothetical protein
MKIIGCIKVAGVVDRNGNVFTEEALRSAAEHDPFLEVRESDGRIELWVSVPKEIVEGSKEESDLLGGGRGISISTREIDKNKT